MTGLPEPELLPDTLLPEIRKRAKNLLPAILDVLGLATKRKNDVLVEVIIAAARFRQIAQLEKNAPTRRRLHQTLTKLRNALKQSREMLCSGDPFTLAALDIGGLPESEAQALYNGNQSGLANILLAIERMTDAALDALQLTGPASGQKAWAEAPKRALALHCVWIFERHHKRRASTTQGGKFRSFVGYVFEIATGQTDADLEKPVKAAIRELRTRGRPETNPIADGLYPLRRYERNLRPGANRRTH